MSSTDFQIALPRAPHAASRLRHGLSFMEVMLSSMIVGVMLVASLRGLAESVRVGHATRERAQAAQLAHDLLSEIITLPHEDPNEPPRFGIEASESAARTSFDDVDDYHNWSESPPVERSGKPIPSADRLTRQARVEWVEPSSLAKNANAGSDAKRITVVVIRQSGTPVLATAVGYQFRGTVMESSSTMVGRDPGSNRPPVASFTTSAISGTDSLTVSFDASASFDPDGGPLRYDWDFGDHTKSTSIAPVHTLVNSSLIDKAFRVRLTVFDSVGAQRSATKTLVVFAD